MESLTEQLAEIQYRHDYFHNQLCSCLAVRPAGDSLRVMLNHGLLLKARPGGFVLLFDTRHAGNRRTRADVLKAGIALRFVLRLKDPDFYNYTEPTPDDLRKKVFYFYNRPGSSFLSAGEQVSAGDLFDIAPPDKQPPGKKIIPENVTGTFEKPFAILGLRLRQGMEETYQIVFQSRSTQWNYILVSSHLKELSQPAIINTGTRECFIGPSAVRLPDERVGLSFLSPAPVRLSERPAGSYMLVENFDPATRKYRVVIPTLPVPDTRIISATRNRVAGQSMSEIFLY